MEENSVKLTLNGPSQPAVTVSVSYLDAEFFPKTVQQNFHHGSPVTHSLTSPYAIDFQ